MWALQMMRAFAVMAAVGIVAVMTVLAVSGLASQP